MAPVSHNIGDVEKHNYLAPLAIIGFSLRFPQDAVSPESFWKLIMEKRCTSSDFPLGRMNIDAHHHPDINRLDSLTMRGGHFIQEDLGAFDAPFFSITATEAEALDPQHRFTLETAYRALENAGIPIEQVTGSKTSVFTGCFTSDYSLFISRDLEGPPKYTAVGTQMNMLANRISWFFNLVGPSVNVDSACSSSMMALDLACQSLWSGDSTMGLVAGSNLLFIPDFMCRLDNLGFLSRDSRCYSFDDRANGYARGDGFGVIVIKPLVDAIRDGDTIRAVIRSSASNQDGKTPGITQPSKESQEQLIRETYQKAGLDMGITRYFEAHGTGTPVGDPIEARAIGAAFRRYRSPDDPLYIGAVKSNIGHLEGASGIAGVIKTIMVLEKGIIPPNANFEFLNPKIDAEFLNIKFPLSATPWPTSGLRRASVSSFGFGGSNSHIVLDDAYNFLRMRNLDGNHCTFHESPSPRLLELASVDSTSGDYGLNGTSDTNDQPGLDGSHEINGTTHLYSGTTRSNGIFDGDEIILHKALLTEGEVPSEFDQKILVWSAADEDGIARLASTWGPYFSNLSIPDSDKTHYLCDLAHTLAVRRSNLPWKTFAIANPIQDLRNIAEKFAPPIRSISSPGLAFIFTGQGAQWYAMGRELLAKYPIFKRSLLDAEAYLQTLGCHWHLMDELQKGKSESNVNNPAYSQPLCLALQVALVDLLEGFGIVPAAVVGHSSGEIAAAYCARAISRQSAWKLAYYRGSLASKLEKSSRVKGAMLSVSLSKAQTQRYLEKVSVHFGSLEVVVACINSPNNVTISGDEVQIEWLKTLLDDEKIFARKLQVNVAYHSFQMNEIASQYKACIDNLEAAPHRGKAPLMVSSVTGTWTSKAELSQSDYWVRNMVSPVQFAGALAELCSQSTKDRTKKVDGSHRRSILIHSLLEIGPHSALQGPSKDILKSINQDKDITYFSMLVRNVSAINTTLEVAGRLYCTGYLINMSAVNGEAFTKSPKRPKTLCDLPEYPFNHTRSYWHESRISKNFRFRRFGKLDLLGVQDPDWNPLEAKWRNIIKVPEVPWVKEHKINNTILYPAVGMLVMAIEAAKQLADIGRIITGFTIKDATFHSTLNIPVRPEGIETQLYMRPTKTSDEKDVDWFDFRLCTHNDSKWTENCKGSIQVVYERIETEIDGGKESREWRRCHQQGYANALKSCTTLVDSEFMYNHLEKCGYQYGLAFKPLTALAHSGTDEATAEVRTFQWSSHENTSVVQPHTIHPTTFDGILQIVLVMLSKGGHELMPTVIPIHIEKLWLSSTGLSHPATDFVKVFAKTKWTGIRETTSSIVTLDKDASEILMTIEGVRTTVVSSHEAATQLQVVENKLCYNVDWKPDVDLLTKKQTQMYCEQAFQATEEPVQFFEDIDFLLTVFITRAIGPMLGREHERLEPHVRKYLDWMVRQKGLLDGGMSPFSPLEWKHRMNDTAYINELCDRIEGSCAQGKFFVTVGRNLLAILSGELDTLNLLFQGDLVKDHYFEVYNSVPSLKRFARYLDGLAHKNPSLKILEVGAGTGAMTVQIMKILAVHGENELGVPRYGQYDYTDISRSFFGPAQELFTDHGKRLNFKALNIEKDPELQGFECGTYDVVVAASVLHATANLAVTLKNVRKLLKPGGKLALFESTKPDVFRSAFVFGLLEGWWLSSEEYRKWSPCVDEEKWDELLLQSGFSGSDLILHDYEDDRCHEFSIILSTAVDIPQAPTEFPKIALILERSSTMQQMLAEQLKVRLEATGRVGGGSGVEIWSIDQAITADPSSDTVYLFILELDRPVLYDMNKELFAKVQRLLISTKKIIWVSQGGGTQRASPKSRMVDGLARVLSAEDGRVVFTTIALDSAEHRTHLQVEKIIKVLQATASSPAEDLETEYVEQDGLLQINRLVEANYLNNEVHSKILPQQARIQNFGKGPPLRLSIASPGLLDTLQFLEDKEQSQPLGPGEVEIEVKAVGLNFRDVLIALGRLNRTGMGGEFAGVVTRIGEACTGIQPGNRVVTCYPDCCKSYVRVDWKCIVEIPNCLSFVEAASLPINYTTAWHALHEVARVQPGESVLIHSGAGGTGQAAIQVAQYLGANVFATVSTESKKQLLIDLYNIPEEQIFYSRNTSFAKGIKRLTSNHGVDVVLNSLSGEGLLASWESIAPFGRFLEIGKKDIYSYGKLPMFPFAKNVTFSAIDVAEISVKRTLLMTKALKTVISLLVAGKLRTAQPLQVYGISDIENAFRSMQSGRTSGKIVFEMRKEDPVLTVLDTRPTWDFDSSVTYVIAGGLGGLGRSIARWIVKRGARNLILLSRSGPKTESSKTLVKDLAAQGVHVTTPACDITNKSLLEAVLRNSTSTMPPVKGCIQASMVLKDSTFENMSFEDWRAATRPKVQGSWNLHELLPSGMDFFIMLSSMAGIFGSRGQSNYAAGNTFQDELARHRVALGEKATALDLGFFSSVGIMAENKELKERFSSYSDFRHVMEPELHALLDYYCDPNLDLLTSLKCQTVVGIGVSAGLRERSLDTAYWLRMPSFRHLVQVDRTGDAAVSKPQQIVDFASLFATAASLDEAGAFVTEALIKKLSKMLSIAQEELDAHKPMHLYGVDSLVAVELRNWFVRELHADVAIFDILGAATTATVGMLVAEKSGYRQAAWMN